MNQEVFQRAMGVLEAKLVSGIALAPMLAQRRWIRCWQPIGAIAST
jgi:hypothetical protein